jgi:hypothetical protein
MLALVLARTAALRAFVARRAAGRRR